jgi:hypothetical protein
MNSRFTRPVVCIVVLLIATAAPAATVWNEAVNGDLSSVPATPTPLNLSIGSNTISATMPGADLDFLSINVPAGTQLSNLLLTGYEGIDEISFIAIATGAQFPASPVQTYDPTGLLGYTHFGPGVGNIGDDLLPLLSVADFGVPGFDIPLPAGSYSFWIQQESPADTAYQLDFELTQVPEPATLLLTAFAAGCLVAVTSTRRRRSND